MGIHPSPFELDHFMNLMDADGSGMVEFGDFVSVMSSELNVSPNIVTERKTERR